MPQDAKTAIEEGTQMYRPGGFHPVYIGDVFKDRYKALNKIGYGVYSTVWLVRDLEPAQSGPENEFRALKVLSAECYEGKEVPIFEREILTHLRHGDRHQLGYNHVCHILDDFEHRGPNGTHVCLVFELMGETLRSFGAWFAESRLPNSVMRRFTIQLLLVLDFAHEHNVIHTDIKPDNIFVKLRDYSLIESGYLADVAVPLQDRSEEQYSVVPSTPLRRYYFNEADSRRAAEFDIALGDWGVSSWTDRHLCGLIQPAPWDASTDFWNLGAVVLEVFQAVRMFSGSVPPDGHYELKEHLAEIVDLFGPFPNELLEKGSESLVQNLFDGDGWIKDAPPMDPPGLASEAFMPGLDQELRDEFASFLHAMMKINPADRVSAEDLLRHPWLDAL
ncbi:kinase-like domain-containing protein [Aspergillus pseudonomiae]|uniref:non-specific serine/threonine protein kinase n=1 Tax=Aspergillus pseudonomiae TaxID=1506151 RepID=A0A5N6HLJ4_9EURO|nr:kinase-like domain-containing protein [Aspergillus pseudonomiae]KAB8255138.1 kinase-like domain-containing protein [Aspergillus pseudonomiae]KAE8397587.1 kinase-like domain-containing protein [Aspergillus pseudonomiae]